MLKISNLHTYYGAIHALKGLDMEVGQGEIVSLIGSNGAGKSTLLNTIIGVTKSSKGTVVFEGKDITRVPAHKIVEMGIAHVPEGRRVFSAQVFREFFNSFMPDLTAAFLLSVFLQTAHRNLCPLHMFSYKNDSPHINSDF